MGLGLTYLFFGVPYLALQNAKNWQSANCAIIDSRVTTHSSTDKDGHTSTSYDLEVSYEYTVNNKRYIGNTYNPAGDDFYKSDLLYKISSDLLSQKNVPCFYNPNKPTESAITIEFPKMIWAGLLPMIFALAGFFGLINFFGSNKKESFIGNQKIIKGTPNRFKNIISYFLITIIWNTITGAVVYGVCFDSDGKITEYFPLLISIPFLLIGALLILGIPYIILQLFNPTISLELSDERPQYNSNYHVKWRVNGNPARVKELVIELAPDWGSLADRNNKDIDWESEYSESELSTEPNNDLSSAVSSPLTEKIADLKSILKSNIIPAYKTTSTNEISSGQTEFAIPDKKDLLLKNSKLDPTAWQLKVTLKIAFYPDVYEIYQL